MFAQTHLRISRFEPRTEMPPHQHDESLIGLVVRGDFVERIDRQERIFCRGTVSFCPAATTHSQRFGSRSVRQIIFTPHPSWLDYLADGKMQLDAAPHARSVAFRDLGERLISEMARDDALSAIAREGILLEIVAAFGRYGASASANLKPPPWLRAAKEFMQAAPCALLPLAEIANAAGRHEIHLAREFRRFYGTSVGGYLRRLRSERAEQMLLKNEHSIGEIAHACGYSNHSHFCREFKARFGVTPTAYRHRSR